MLNLLTIKTGVVPAIFARDFFENEFSTLGFNLTRDSEEGYVSEMTQSAWIGFSLFAKSPVQFETIGMGVADTTVLPEAQVEHLQSDPLDTGACPLTATQHESDSPPANLSKLDVNLLFSGIHQPQLIEHNNIEMTEEEVFELARDRVLLRDMSDKKPYISQKEALKDARAMCEDKCKPFWIYQQDENRYISSHGFDLSKRPDVSPSAIRVNQLQQSEGLLTTQTAPEVEPSVVARLGFNGKFFQQQGIYIRTDNVMEWIDVQKSPAVFISIPDAFNCDRTEILRIFVRDYHDTYNKSCSYRWISRDTVLLTSVEGVTYQPAKEVVSNPHFLLKALTRPNTAIMR